jgi:hypothetical protein
LEKLFLLFPEVSVRPKLNQKERLAFYEINQALVNHIPDAGGTFSRRMGTNLGVNHTGSKKEA